MATIDDLTAIEEKAKQILNDLSNITVDTLLNKLSSMDDLLKRASDDARKMSVNVDTLNNGFDKTAKIVSNIGTVLSSFRGFDRFSIEGGAAINSISKQFEILTERFGGFGEVAKRLGGSLPAAILSGGEAVVKQYLKHVEQAEKLENSYVDLLATTGKLNEVFENEGTRIGNLYGKVATFNTQLEDLKSSTGLTAEEVSQYVAQLGQVPGALDKTVQVGDEGTRTMSALTTAIRVASGAHRSVSEVTDTLRLAYEKLGVPQGKVNDNMGQGLKLFSMMSELSSTLNLRFSDSRQFLEGVAESFKDVGDNTDGASRVLARFSGALRETGLTAKQSVDIVGNMVSAVSKLEMGTKALISLRSGGPGGLQGAFRVEQLLREGRVDDVVKMMENALRRQFGGRIYSLQEASQSPEAAAQFMRQRTMLQSGAFGNLARDEASATRLLEALAKGGAGETQEVIKNSMQSLEATVDRGSSFQERQFTVLNDINNAIDRLVTITEQSYLRDARNVAGTGRTGEALGRTITQNMALSDERSRNTLLNRTTMGNLDIEEIKKQQARVAAIGFSTSLETVTQLKGAAVSTVSNALKDARDLIKSDNTSKSNQRMVEEGQAATRRAVGRSMPGRENTTSQVSFDTQFGSSVSSFERATQIFANSIKMMEQNKNNIPAVTNQQLSQIIQQAPTKTSEPIQINIKVEKPTDLPIKVTSNDASITGGVVNVAYTQK